MNHDSDVEKLFSWLQTPDIRYREFAGAREITNTVSVVRVRTDTQETATPVPHHAKLDEEYPPNQYPDQSRSRVQIEHASTPEASAPPPAAHHEAPVEASPPAPAPSAEANDQTRSPLNTVFNRLSGGRASDRDPRERTSRIPGLRPTDGRPR
jgi:hypothetical protein